MALTTIALFRGTEKPFNKVQLHLLIRKLNDLNVRPPIIRWCHSSLDFSCVLFLSVLLGTLLHAYIVFFGILHLHLHLGHLADGFIQSDKKTTTIHHKREKQFIAVGTVKMFIELSAKHLQVLG